MSNEDVRITLSSGDLILRPSTGEWVLCKKGKQCALPKSSPAKFLQNKEKYKLKILQLQITHRCAMQCVYCTVNAGSLHKEYLPLDVVRSLYSQALSLGLERLALSGGEVFLYPNLMNLLRWLVKIGAQGVHIAITTSGSVPIEKNLLGLLKEIPNLTIAVSLDSYEPAVNEKTRSGVPTNKIIENLLKMTSIGLDVSINTVLTKTNYRPGFIEGFLNWSISHGINRQQFIFMLPSGRGQYHESLMLSDEESESARLEIVELGVKYWGKIQVSDFLEMLSGCVNRQEFCGVGRDRQVVYPNGNVYPCPFLTSSEFLVGNIYRASLMNIWLSNEKVKYYRSLSVEDIEGCNTCEVRYLCGGGCRALAYYTSGNFLDKPRRCPKEAILSLLDKTPALISSLRRV